MNRHRPAQQASRLVALTALLLASALAAAQPAQIPDWQRNAPGQRGVALTLDAGDNVYVAGVAAPSAYDAGVGTAVLSRYAADGTLQWTRSWNGGAVWLGTAYAGMRVRSVFVDAAGQAYLIGDLSYLNTSLSAGGGPSTVLGLASSGWVILKYGADGSLLWANRQPSGAPWVGVRGLTDVNGDLVLLVDPGSASMTMRTLKISGSTGATLWTRSTPDGARPGGLAITLGGHVAVSMASQVWGLSIVEYDAATGVERARTAYPQASGYYAPTLAIGPTGELVASGRSTDGSAIFVAAQDAGHAPLFAATYPQGVQGTQLAVDGAGRILVSGPSATTPSNWVTLLLDRQGQLVRAPQVVDRSALAAELPRDLVLAGDGAAVVVGAAGVPGSTVAGATQATSVRYAADGSVAWLATVPAARSAVDAAPGRDGGVYVLADTDQTLVHYPAALPAVPASLGVSPTAVRGGSTAQGVVGLSSTVGATVRLSSSHPGLVSLPASVVVSPGAGAASFTVRTGRPRSNTAVTLTATANGQSRTVVLTVRR